MPNMNYTALLLIFDASGSMGGHERELMVQAMHEMLEQQARKLAGYITVDAGYFSTNARMMLTDGDPFTVDLGYNGIMGGGTDIAGGFKTLVTEFEQRLKALPEDEQPGHVVVMFSSDGSGNGDYGQAKALTARLKGEGWDFAYLAAEDASDGYSMLDEVNRTLGFPTDCLLSYPLTPDGMSEAAVALGGFITMARGGGEAHV